MKVSSFSLHKYVPHSRDMFISVVPMILCLISTSIVVVIFSSSTKPNSGVTCITVVFKVTKDTNSCFRPGTAITYSVEPFLVAVELQRGLRTNQ